MHIIIICGQCNIQEIVPGVCGEVWGAAGEGAAASCGSSRKFRSIGREERGGKESRNPKGGNERS